MKVSFSPSDDIAMPVSDLRFVEGSKGQFADSILCLGGQSLDAPATLSLISLDSLGNVSIFGGCMLACLLNAKKAPELVRDRKNA